MSIVPHTPTPAYPGRRWQARQYPGNLAHSSRFRADLRADLRELAGVPTETRDDVELCASEAFANALQHSRSRRQGGTVTRLLSTPLVMDEQITLRLCVIDDGPIDTRPRIPARRSVAEWESAASGRGLLLIHRLATEWGTRRWVGTGPAAVRGTVLWAEFAYVARPSCVCGAQ